MLETGFTKILTTFVSVPSHPTPDLTNPSLPVLWWKSFRPTPFPVVIPSRIPLDFLVTVWLFSEKNWLFVCVLINIYVCISLCLHLLYPISSVITLFLSLLYLYDAWRFVRVQVPNIERKKERKNRRELTEILVPNMVRPECFTKKWESIVRRTRVRNPIEGSKQWYTV